MWVYTKPRHSGDKRFLINLDTVPQISMSQLGELWFVDAGAAGDTIALAALTSEPDGRAVMKAIYAAIEEGRQAIDLETVVAEVNARRCGESRPPGA